MNRADPYYFSRQYARAIENLLRVLGREPNFYPAHYNLGHAYAQSGRYAEAIEAFRAAASLSGVPQANAALAYAYAMSGNVSAAQALQAELEHLSANQYVPSPQMAWISLGLGDVERALAKLKQGFEEKSCLMIYLKSDPIYDPLRSHPEFVELMGRMNFI
jgi:tetratricopeptide (TPR) repeat protein